MVLVLTVMLVMLTRATFEEYKKYVQRTQYRCCTKNNVNRDADTIIRNESQKRIKQDTCQIANNSTGDKDYQYTHHDSKSSTSTECKSTKSETNRY